MIKTEDKTPIVHDKIINKINKKNKNKLKKKNVKKNTAKTHISNFKNEKIK